MIKSSKDYYIDLNAKDDFEYTALHWACQLGRKEAVELMMKYRKEFGIEWHQCPKENKQNSTWHCLDDSAWLWKWKSKTDYQNGWSRTWSLIKNNDVYFEIENSHILNDVRLGYWSKYSTAK